MPEGPDVSITIGIKVVTDELIKATEQLDQFLSKVREIQNISQVGIRVV